MSEQPTTTFRQAMQSRRLAISAELTLKRESDAAEIARQAELFRGRVDGLQIADNPLTWVHMSPVAAASLLQRHGLDPIPVLSCRDRNRIALLSELLGLRALDITSVLLTRGTRVPRNHPLRANTVFELSGRELVTLAGELNQETPKADQFLIGSTARVFRAKAGWQPEMLREKATSGAQFLQTQLCLNLNLLRHWLNLLVESRITWRYSVVVKLTPPPSVEVVEWMKRNIKDAKIPPGVIQRLKQAADPEQEGVRICAEAMQQIAEMPGVSGIHLMSTGSPELLAAAIDASGLRA